MKQFFFLLLLFFFFSEAYAQGKEKHIAHNALFVEIGGNAGYGSINYDRLVFSKGLFSLTVRAGLGTYKIYSYENKFDPDLIIPMTVNGLFGNQHKIELALGQTLSSAVVADETSFQAKRQYELFSVFTIGYRYQKTEGGWMFRCAYTPIITPDHFKNWAGISIGYSF